MNPADFPPVTKESTAASLSYGLNPINAADFFLPTGGSKSAAALRR
jgi:hypothetical protein